MSSLNYLDNSPFLTQASFTSIIATLNSTYIKQFVTHMSENICCLIVYTNSLTLEN